MNRRAIIDSVVISLLAAAAIKFAYGVENIYVVLGINIILVISLYFILSSYNKNVRQKEEENKKNIIELIEKNIKTIDNLGSVINEDNKLQIEYLVSSIDLHGNNNIDNIQRLTDELKNEMGIARKEINSSINESTQINTQAMSVLKEMCKDNIEQNKNLDSNHNSLVEMLVDIEGNIVEGNNKTEVVISSIVDNINNVKFVNESIVESNNKLSEIITKSGEKVDKLIEMRSSLENLNDKVDDMTTIDRENHETLSDIKDDNSVLNMELRKKIDESIESNNNIVTKYDFIQKSFTAELLKVTCKNEEITNLLKDNYKILNGFTDLI